jgi:hypothetical protein
MRAVIVSVSVLLLGGSTAFAGGGPAPSVLQGGQGVEQGIVRYVAVPSVRRTVIEAIDLSDGRVLSYMSLEGRFGIPIVSYDGTTDGLQPSGPILVLGDSGANGGGLRRQSLFAVVDVWKMRRLRTIRLAGDFSFDAVAPTGKYLYLIEHVSLRDPSRYRVRAYDLRANKLLARVIVDKREWEPTMQGLPVARTATKSGNWVYTLYGGTKKTFIHALDARNANAVCIDLPWKKQPVRLFEWRLRLRADGMLVVRGPNGRALAVVDPQSYRVLSSVTHP